MLRSAVIGLGDIGPVHVKAIKGLPGAQLAAVCDIDQALRPQDTKLPFFTDYREMLEAIHPDCVHICLPHYLHYPAALDAARAGCHVLTEKPLAMNIENSRLLPAAPLPQFMVLLPGPGARPTMTRSPGVGKWTLPAAAA